MGNWNIHNDDDKPKSPFSSSSTTDGGSCNGGCSGPITILVYFFYLISVTTLSLLIPLAYLLLARLSSANYLTTPQQFHQNSLLHPANILLQLTVTAVTISTFMNCLNAKRVINNTTTTPNTTGLIRLPIAWFILWVFHLSVGLGVRASMDVAGGDVLVGISLSKEQYRSGMMMISGYLGVIRRVVFFVGVHETMMHWYRMVVKQVARDTIYGGGGGGGRVRENGSGGGLVERLALVGSCWLMCWMLLRDEVEVLAIVAEVKMKSGVVGVGVEDVVGWWLYYLTVTIGMARLVQGVLWFVMVTVVGRVRVEMSREYSGADSGGDGGGEFYEHEDLESVIVL